MAEHGNIPAFPLSYHREMYNKDGQLVSAQFGMSLRDWFAGQVLARLVSPETTSANGADVDAQIAYAYADAMLQERGG